MKKYSYAASLVWVFLLPTIYIWAVLNIRIPIIQMGMFLILITIVGSFYDVWAARHGAHDRHWIWSFNRNNTAGVWFWDLPLQEYLFYTLSALYVVIAWEGVKAGYEMTSWYHLGVLTGAIIWTVGGVLLSFRVTGYDK